MKAARHLRCLIVRQFWRVRLGVILLVAWEKSTIGETVGGDVVLAGNLYLSTTKIARYYHRTEFQNRFSTISLAFNLI